MSTYLKPIVTAPELAQETQLLGHDDASPTTDASGADVTDAWNLDDGGGVTIADIDDGFDAAVFAHFSQASRSFSGNLSVAPPAGQTHGAIISSILAAAAADNPSGLSGIAPGATLLGVQVDDSLAPLPATAAFDFAATNAAVIDLSVTLSGYGIGREGDADAAAAYAVLQTAVATDRGGLGDAIVVPAGDDGGNGQGDTLALQPFLSNDRLIAIGGVTAEGGPDPAVTEGPGMLVSAADQDDAALLADGSQQAASGDDEAAAQVAGDIALMLAANRGLGWRDIQKILADSAYQPDAAAFTTDGAKDWNGGGMRFSNAEGFGVVDADVATYLAQAWFEQSTSRNLVTSTATNAAMLSLPYETSVAARVAVAGDVTVQKVVVNFAASNLPLQGATVVLTSPDGNRSTLFSDAGDGTVTLDHAQVTDNAFMGEDGKGNWTVSILNTQTGQAVPYLDGFSVTIDGDGTATPDPLVYTPEFDAIAASGRASVVDNGSHGIDLIALPNATSIDLAGGAGTIDGAAVTVGTGLTAARANGATGPVSLTAATGNDLLWGGLGDTTLIGGAGHDTLIAGGGNTVVVTNAKGYDRIDFTQAATASGTPSGIVATHGGDTVLAGAADLSVTAVQGATTVIGGTGMLDVQGGSGTTLVTAGAGSTTVAGGRGLMSVSGTTGDVDLVGGAGVLKASLRAGSVTLAGGMGAVNLAAAGNMQVTGGSGDMVLTQGAGMLVVTGGAGRTTINGGSGAMSVTAGTGGATVVQGAGNATIAGAGGTLSVRGGAGTLDVTGAGGAMTVAGGAGAVTVQAATGMLTFTGGKGAALLDLDAGAATITPGAGKMTVAGGTGAIVLNAGTGAVTLLGGSGNLIATGGSTGGNVLVAGTAAATLTGGGAGDVLSANGAAAQTLAAGTGAETLAGGSASGADIFVAGGGNEVIALGAGADTVTFLVGHVGAFGYAVSGFGAADSLHLQGYGVSEAATALAAQLPDGLGGTFLTLKGGARIDLLGVAHAGSGVFA